MNFIDVILILIIVFVLYLIFQYKPSIKNENITHNSFIKNNKPEEMFGDIEDNKDYLGEIIKDNKKQKIKKNNNNNNKDQNNNNYTFVEAQYHTDYRDTITAFNNIVPCQKPMFNPASLPTNRSILEPKQVKKIVTDFIKQVNDDIINEVPEYRNKNSGWDEPIVEKKIKSGWEKQMESLGLPSSLYPDPAINDKIKLISIDFAEKFETDSEIKYVVYLFIKKKNVKDQLFIRINFIENIKDINEERDFFNNKNIKKQLEIYIEEIFIIGYMTIDTENTQDTSGKKPEDFYKFDNLENQDILDQGVIVKELIKKYKQRTQEMNNFNADLYNDNKMSVGKPKIMGLNSNDLVGELFNERSYS